MAIASRVTSSIAAATIILGVGFLSWSVASEMTESDYRNVLCKGMEQERRLPNGTRVDCLTDRLAIEIDWTDKWAEAIGQALLYSASTGKQPAVILICKVASEKCRDHDYLINEVVAHWQLPITVWLCPTGATELSECSLDSRDGERRVR